MRNDMSDRFDGRSPAAPKLAAIFTLLALLPAAMWHEPVGAQEPAFSGDFAISDVVETGDQVVLMLTLRVSNDNHFPVRSARVALEHPDAPHDQDDLAPEWTFGTFEGVDIQPRKRVRISARLLIPATEYIRWQQAHRPRFRIRFHDEAGASQRHDLELTETAEIPLDSRAF
jgi:hypothetical protein